jgi:NADH dehydrogenase FAD-containing subunit
VKRILLIGAGHAHIVVLRQFAKHRPDAEIILVNDTAHAWYTGALSALIRGDIPPRNAKLDLQKLAARANVSLKIATFERHSDPPPVMAGLDPAIHAFFTNHAPIECDILSLSIGGVKTETGIKPIPDFLRRIETWEAEQNPKIAIIGSGAAGIELALALRIRLGKKADIQIQSSDLLLLPTAPPKAQKAATRALQNANIKIVKILPAGFNTITAYTPEPSIQITETLQLCPRPNHPVIPAKAGISSNDLTAERDSGLRRNDDAEQSGKIFITGDAAKFPTPLPRSGAIAVRQGRTLAYNLTHDRPKKFQPPPATLAILSLNSRQAIAWYGKFSWTGRLPMRLKNYLDKKWIS